MVDESNDSVTVGFVDLPVCNDAKAENIFNASNHPCMIKALNGPIAKDLAVTTATS